jgi:hypothetical protein
MATPVAFWRIHCHIGHHPGQWQRWYRDQCCAIGWPPRRWGGEVNRDGYLANDPGEPDFATSIGHCRSMRPGDWIMATLTGNRVGRLGRVFEVRVEDEDWQPIVAPNKLRPFGENGRRVLVRWDLSVGPRDPSQIVLLPLKSRLVGGQIRGTVRKLPIERLDVIRAAMDDPSNWVSLASSFNVETALSSYIALHPHRLEEGLVSHSAFGANEQSMPDGGRVDVLLEDELGRTVVVECKQGGATISACEQVIRYRRQIERLVPAGQKVRALVVHGGSKRASDEVLAFAKSKGVELVFFELAVNFSNTN